MLINKAGPGHGAHPGSWLSAQSPVLSQPIHSLLAQFKWWRLSSAPFLFFFFLFFYFLLYERRQPRHMSKGKYNIVHLRCNNSKQSLSVAALSFIILRSWFDKHLLRLLIWPCFRRRLGIGKSQSPFQTQLLYGHVPVLAQEPKGPWHGSFMRTDVSRVTQLPICNPRAGLLADSLVILQLGSADPQSHPSEVSRTLYRSTGQFVPLLSLLHGLHKPLEPLHKPRVWCYLLKNCKKETRSYVSFILPTFLPRCSGC